MLIWTIQMGKWRLAESKGIQLIDTTYKSGNFVFAPDKDLVAAYKYYGLLEEDYTEYYRSKMLWSMVAYREEWIKLSQSERIALACYCGPENFCHRHLLAQYLYNFLKQNNIDATLMGELL